MGLLIDTGVLIRVERGLRAIRASFCLAAFCPCRTGRDVDTARCDETLALPVLSRVPKAEIGAGWFLTAPYNEARHGNVRLSPPLRKAAQVQRVPPDRRRWGQAQRAVGFALLKSPLALPSCRLPTIASYRLARREHE